MIEVAIGAYMLVVWVGIMLHVSLALKAPTFTAFATRCLFWPLYVAQFLVILLVALLHEAWGCLVFLVQDLRHPPWLDEDA